MLVLRPEQHVLLADTFGTSTTRRRCDGVRSVAGRPAILAVVRASSFGCGAGVVMLRRRLPEGRHGDLHPVIPSGGILLFAIVVTVLDGIPAAEGHAGKS